MSQNYTAPDSSAGERYFLKVLTVLQWTQSADSEFQLPIMACTFLHSDTYLFTYLLTYTSLVV